VHALHEQLREVTPDDFIVDNPPIQFRQLRVRHFAFQVSQKEQA
jgi:hypothetical protein